MTDAERAVLMEIQRRKDAGENPCEMCNATGWIRGFVCSFCLGQQVTLSEYEHQTLSFIEEDNRILSDEYLA